MIVVSAVVAVMTLVAVRAYRPYRGPWESAPKWFFFGVGVALTASCFGVVLGAIWLRVQRDGR
jgi:4-amino-4-deoxy-L-arabinose transferase-like glycosyltransferase